jgi:uncharacterized protein YwgA
MSQTEEANPELVKPPKGHKGASFYFWVSILTLAGITIALQILGMVRSSEPKSYDIEPTIMEMLLSNAATEAQTVVLPQIEEELLDNVYAPVYAAIPAYAEFHYSVFGEYTQLFSVVVESMADGIEQRLLDGFEQRLQGATEKIDNDFVIAYRDALDRQIDSELLSSDVALPLGELTEVVMSDAIDRARTTVPVATITAGVVGGGGLKVASAAMTKKLVAKYAAKGAIKGGSVLAGAGSGALLCSWTGPWAAACGVAGGVIAWLATDQIILKVDEVMNRDEFETTLREIIDEDRMEKQALLESALTGKAAQLDSATSEIIQPFRMRDLAND